MKTSTIKEVYGRTHGAIRNNPELIRIIKNLATHPTHQQAGQYLPLGRKIGTNIYLGLDFTPRHINNFLRILVHTMIIENLSSYTADLSRVLLRVIVDGEHVANLTEDVSENGTLVINDQGCTFGPYDYLKLYFKNDVEKSTFIVYQKPKPKVRVGEEKPQPLAVRLPIIDLDHIEPIDMLISLYTDFEKIESAAIEFHTLEI